jgi:hypothetical protein
MDHFLYDLHNGVFKPRVEVGRFFVEFSQSALICVQDLETDGEAPRGSWSANSRASWPD